MHRLTNARTCDDAPKEYSGHVWLEIKHHPLVWSRITPWHVHIFYIPQPTTPSPPPHRIDLCLGRRDQITRHSIVCVSLSLINPLSLVLPYQSNVYYYLLTRLCIFWDFQKDPRRRRSRQALSKPSQTTNTRQGTMAINFNAFSFVIVCKSYVVLSHRIVTLNNLKCLEFVFLRSLPRFSA